MKRSCFLFYLFIAALFYQPSLAQTSITKNVKTVLFLGNSITWAGTYVNDIETYYRVQYPGREIEFINVGLPSETVSGLSEPGHANGEFPRPDLHERLARVLQQTKPDLVFACYGMNDGIYMPFDSTRFKKFKEGTLWLHDEVTKTGAEIIHLTPPDYDELRGKCKGYSVVLDLYSDWLLSLRQSMQWQVIDIHYAMKKYLLAHRQADAKFGMDAFALAEDGIHPGETGHWIMAREVLIYLGFKGLEKTAGIQQGIQQNADPLKLIKLITERQTLLRDAWLTATGYIRPGLPAGLPLAEAQAKAREMLKEIKQLLLAKQ
ncbi:MAG: SGNH/GDSL hydrolase family protein [Bacteroidetes bacterium]|nr:SGNH/GDSL hydrolase family protein [Bacteroidota bacterium]